MPDSKPQTMPDVNQLTWLRKHGYDGLYCDLGNEGACGCWVDDLAPCGGIQPCCVPAREVPCHGPYCECGGDGTGTHMVRAEEVTP